MICPGGILAPTLRGRTLLASFYVLPDHIKKHRSRVFDDFADMSVQHGMVSTITRTRPPKSPTALPEAFAADFMIQMPQRIAVLGRKRCSS